MFIYNYFNIIAHIINYIYFMDYFVISNFPIKIRFFCLEVFFIIILIMNELFILFFYSLLFLMFNLFFENFNFYDLFLKISFFALIFNAIYILYGR